MSVCLCDEFFPCTPLRGPKNYFFGNDVYRQNINELGRKQHFFKNYFFKKFWSHMYYGGLWSFGRCIMRGSEGVAPSGGPGAEPPALKRKIIHTRAVLQILNLDMPLKSD